MPSVLFVCTANRIRSPLAAAYFRREVELHGRAGNWNVTSAGTWTTNGLPATAEAIRGARLLGLDIRGHTSRVVNREIIEGADVVLVMEQGQKEALCSEFPDCAHKVHLLSEAATGVAYDVPDPRSLLAAAEVHSEIDELIHKGFDRICALTGEG